MKNAKGTVEFQQVIERGCGIDVHKETIVAAIRGNNIKSQVREFKSFTKGIKEMGQWLKDNGITHVAMESTGVYWKPVYNILEDDFEVILVNAQHVKNVPGHKTDKKDSKWLAKLLLSGLLKGSFIPSRYVRELRDLTRYKRKIIQQIAAEKNRIQRILEDANIKLSSVVSNVNGATSQKIIKAMLNGQEAPRELAQYRHGRMKSSLGQLMDALEGSITDHHRFMLQTIKNSIIEKEALLEQLQHRIDEHLKANAMELDAERLATIPGVGKEGAANILAEIGNNMDQFPDEKHLSSWAGMSPGSNESAGKKKARE